MVAAVVPPIRAAAVFANASLLEMRESFGTENAKALNGIRDARVRAERRTMAREDRQDDYLVDCGYIIMLYDDTSIRLRSLVL